MDQTLLTNNLHLIRLLVDKFFESDARLYVDSVTFTELRGFQRELEKCETS